jgi:hypothetical protein
LPDERAGSWFATLLKRVGQALRITLNGYKGVLQEPFYVMIERFDPANHTISVVTLEGSPITTEISRSTFLTMFARQTLAIEFKMRKSWKLVVFIAALVIAIMILGFGKIYAFRDDCGGYLLWNADEAYLFIGVARQGFRISYLEYPWVILKESLYGVRLPDDQRTSVTVVHITASGVEHHVVEMLDEQPPNNPILYTRLQGNIYANCEGYLCKWTGNKFEVATEEEQHRLGGTSQLVEKNMEKGWSQRGFGGRRQIISSPLMWARHSSWV